jgi:hypothetical protein
MLNEEKSEKDEVMSQPMKMPLSGGDSDDSDDDDDEDDQTDKEIAKCYYLILDIKIRGFEIVYDEVDRLTGRDQAGSKVSKISLMAGEKLLALDLFDFIRPRVLRAITKGYSSSFKEPLQAILDVFPEPPAELATSKAAICAYLTDIFVQNQVNQSPFNRPTFGIALNIRTKSVAIRSDVSFLTDARWPLHCFARISCSRFLAGS